MAGMTGTTDINRFDPGIYLKDSSTLAKGEDPFKYDIFRQAVSDIAEKTREVQVPDLYGIQKGAIRTGKFPRKSFERAQLEAAASSYGAQAESTKQQAEKAAKALTLQGATTEMSMQRLGQLSQEAYESKATASEQWGNAAEQAAEYVQSASLRTKDALARLDGINKDIAQGRDYAKAHAMNAAVQSVIGSLSELEDQTIQKYGVDSKEYQQFRAKKAQSLSTTQSQIETSYRQLAEQQNITYMNASNELQWKEDMYESYQQQQHVETLRYLAQADQAYDLQFSQFQVALAQMRGTTMENMANWMVETPTFSVDMMPYVSLIADMVATANPPATKGGMVNLSDKAREYRSMYV